MTSDKCHYCIIKFITTFENNIIYMANVSGIVHKGFNHIKNNIIVDCSSKESIRFASYPDEQ